MITEFRVCRQRPHDQHGRNVALHGMALAGWEERTMRHGMKMFAALLLIGPVAALSCKREDRGFRVDPPSATPAEAIALTDLHPGPSTMPATTEPAGMPVSHVNNEYEKNAYALSEGQRLFESFNCVGCHAHGGGGMAPPLIDDVWIYGGSSEQIYATIVQGRPNGMPSWRGKIPDHQVWQIVAYVRSMSGNASKQAASGREDHMFTGEPENSRKPESPKQATVPQPVQSPQ